MFPTAGEFVLFVLLVVVLPLALSATLPLVTWKLRDRHALAASLLLVAESFIAAGLAWFAVGQTRWVPLVAGAFVLSTLVTFALLVGRGPRPVLALAGVVLIAGGVVSGWALLEEREEHEHERAQSDELLAELERCRTQFGPAVTLVEPLPSGWTTKTATTFDGLEHALVGPFQAELNLSCLGGRAVVLVRLDGPEDELEARLHDLDALPLKQAWVVRAKERLQSGALRLERLPTEPELRRCFFSLPLEPTDVGP